MHGTFNQGRCTLNFNFNNASDEEDDCCLDAQIQVSHPVAAMTLDRWYDGTRHGSEIVLHGTFSREWGGKGDATLSLKSLSAETFERRTQGTWFKQSKIQEWLARRKHEISVYEEDDQERWLEDSDAATSLGASPHPSLLSVEELEELPRLCLRDQ